MPDELPEGKEGKADAPAPAKDAKPAEKPADGKKEEFNPDPNHPRYKEVYWRMKKTERELEERAKDIEALRAHNERMAQAVEELKTVKKADDPEPDAAADPEAYKAWSKLQLAKKDKEYQERLDKQRVATLIEIESGLHDDYDKAVKVAEREMSRDPALQKKVWGAANPARAAYQLGRKVMDEAAQKDKEEQERQETLDAGAVHKDSPAPAKTPAQEDELTDDEKRVVRNLFPGQDYKEAAKKYIAQKKALSGARG